MVTIKSYNGLKQTKKKDLTHTIIIDILLLIGVVYLFTMCSYKGNKDTYNNVNTTNSNYNINHYIDTINGNVILTTVCKAIDSNDLSVSTLKIK